MTLPILLAFITTLLFGSIAIILSIREGKSTKELLQRDQLQRRRLYEITILKAIQDRIGYSLDSEKIVDTLTSSLKNLFPYSVASSLLIKPDQNKIIFKCTIEERVNSQFISDVKKSMLASLVSLVGKPLPTEIEEVKLGVVADDTNTQPLSSFFHIPLVVNGSIVGLINVSSTKPGLYKDEDMTILYQMTAQASGALSRLRQVIATEEGKLLAMLKSLADGIFMVDSNNQLTVINETAKKLLHIETESVNPTIFDVLSPLSHRGDFGTKLQQAMKTVKPLDPEEILVEDTTLQVFINPVYGSSDEGVQTIIGAAVTLHDITLERSLSKLKEEFTSEIVHELRSPLTAIKAGSELLLTESEKLDTEQKTKLLDIINKQSIRMLADINSLLDAAKLESGHFSIYQKSIEVSNTIQDSVALFTPNAREKGVSLSIEIEANLPKGYFDTVRIGQVLDNLLSNSLKFTPNGGAIIIKARKYFNDYLPKTSTNPGILISISDTGIGIPKEKQGKLFSKFAQLENIGFIHGSEGTGLGLYIAKGIVEAHGGQIFLQSIPQHGTTVSFTIPLALHTNDLLPVADIPSPIHLAN